MLNSQELERIRTEYLEREKRWVGKDRYSLFNPGHLFALQGRHRAVLSILQEAGFHSLENLNILEVGCGNGGVLMDFLPLIPDSGRLHGVDLLFQRILTAKAQLTHLPLCCANGENLPYPSGAFDLIFQFTMFSSILDMGMKKHIAEEMLRLLRKPQGAILWYDFWLNPTNNQTRGIRPEELRSLFPGCSFTFQKITLAPPIARRVVPLSWVLASFLEKLRIFNSHYLALIRPLVS